MDADETHYDEPRTPRHFAEDINLLERAISALKELAKRDNLTGRSEVNDAILEEFAMILQEEQLEMINFEEKQIRGEEE